MSTKSRYEEARAMYAKLGVDTDKALETLSGIRISMHCWQGDDVRGFDTRGPLTGGIQSTGNFPGRARTPEELMADIDQALRLIPGKHKINLHASYAIFGDGEWADRDQLLPEHFKVWVDFARKRGLGLDFNPTLFSHPLSSEATLSSENDEIRAFWIRHCIASLRISEYFATELGQPCLMNIWIPDGFKDIPADRTSPRARLKDSLDMILDTDYDRSKVYISVESKVFGIGVESMTVGSHEFYMNYAARRNVLCLLDTGHFHPTETVSDKISSMLLFNDRLALHVSRPVRWDSDHVVLFDDETRELAKEIIRNDASRILIGMDFFDGSINRICAWVTGMQSMQKSLLYALLLPDREMSAMQYKRNFSKLLYTSELFKSMPFGDIWNHYLECNGIGSNWYDEVEDYQHKVLSKRG